MEPVTIAITIIKIASELISAGMRIFQKEPLTPEQIELLKIISQRDAILSRYGTSKEQIQELIRQHKEGG